MADFPLPQLQNRTVLQAAEKPTIDRLASMSELGMVKTVPNGINPGSDVANLSVMGYDPVTYYTGRSPLEAMSIGIDLAPTDIAFRCNLVTLSNEPVYQKKRMVDYCADEISTSEAEQLIKYLKDSFDSEEFAFYTGVSYRHCMVWKNGLEKLNLTPPHDILDSYIENHLPLADERCNPILEMMKKSYDLLRLHPINLKRMEARKNPANSIWLWGEGTKPSLPSFNEKFNLKGCVISAVDLIKGIGLCAGLDSIDVEGATGTLHTNFQGKTQAALDALKNGFDFVYLHIEAPDECGHQNDLAGKIKSIESIDSDVFVPLLKGLSQFDDYKLMFLPDHPTPIRLRTHTSDSVPYMIYQKSRAKTNKAVSYCEVAGEATGLYFELGHTLINHFLK
jgi:2,3-bisphosphoglycerate-independent phosphoglycerate mutase